jgi:hypothetical protein
MRSTNTFDWSTLDRVTLFDILYSLENKIVNQTLTIEQLHTKLTNKIKKDLPIRFRKLRDSKVMPGWVYVGGAYYSNYDEDFKKCIEINFNYSTTDKALCLTKKRFCRLCISFADTILHEIIHVRQHRRRNWKVLPDFPSTASRTKRREEQSYLGCRDEIDAYSFNIACELYDRFNGAQPKIIKHLNSNQKIVKRRGDSYSDYLTTFGNDHNHPVIKHLKKKIVSYLPQAAIGKPYKNGDWIRY